MDSETVHLLLVDDDDVDVMGIQRSFRNLKIANPVQVARDGLEALEILRGDNGEPPLPRPHIILLDLNMPRMGGIEFLKELRQDEELHASVVFVLTTSSAQKDVTEAYELNVAGYIVKSNFESGFLPAITMLESYWRIVVLP